MADAGPAEWVLGGWQVTGITTLATGVPLAIRGAQNNAADRPNSTGQSAKLPPEERNEHLWFNTAAFTAPTLFTYGNVGRVLPDVRAPGMVQFDAGLQKFFNFGERVRLQFRAEGFNVLNHVNLGPPDVNFLSNGFGSITSTSTPARIIQLGAKLIF